MNPLFKKQLILAIVLRLNGDSIIKINIYLPLRDSLFKSIIKDVLSLLLKNLLILSCRDQNM